MLNQMKKIFWAVCVFCFVFAFNKAVFAICNKGDMALTDAYLKYVRQEQAFKKIRDAKLSDAEEAAILNAFSTEEQAFKNALGGDFRIVAGSWGIKNAKLSLGTSSWGTIFTHAFTAIKSCPGVDLVFLTHELLGQIEENANSHNCRQSGICFVLPFGPGLLGFRIKKVDFNSPFLLANGLPLELMGRFFRRIEVLQDQGKLTPASIKLVTKFIRALVSGDCAALEKMQETWKKKTVMVIWHLHWVSVDCLGNKAPDPVINPIFHFRPVKADCTRGPTFVVTTKTGKRFAYTFRLASFIEGGKAFCKRIKGKNWKGVVEVKIPAAH